MTTRPTALVAQKLSHVRSSWADVAASIEAIPNVAILSALVVIAIIVRLAVVDVDTIHADESLFASQALQIITSRDLLLLQVVTPLDKPLPFFWVLAAIIAAFGNTPMSIRIMDLGAAVLTVIGIFVIGDRLAGRLAGGLAALLFVLSPFAILFGATVFTDPPAVALGVLGLAVAASGHRPTLAGVLVGAGVSAKLFAIAYAPLGLGVCILALNHGRLRAAGHYVTGWVVAAGMLVLLMAARTVLFGAPWFLAVQLAGVGGAGIELPSQWATRAEDWALLTQYFAVGLAIRAIVFSGLTVAAILLILRTQLSRQMLLLWAFILSYLALLIVIDVPVFDRYLLPILPMVCLVAGIGLSQGIGWLRSSGLKAISVVAVTAVLLVRSTGVVIQAETGAFPVGSQSDVSMSGYRQLCDWLTSESRQPIVVWNHSLSWTLGYCLQESTVYAYWYPDPQAIIIQPGVPTFVALSDLDDPTAVVAAIDARRMTAVLEATFYAKGHPNLWLYWVTSGGGPLGCKPDLPGHRSRST